jgi:hypothetical protein
MRSLAIILGLLLLGMTPLRGSDQTVPIQMRRVWCCHDFSPASYPTFQLEKLKEPNNLSMDVWAAVQKEIIAGMEARGYRHEPNTGQLCVSYGAFPPNDVSHPEVGLYLKLRRGTQMLDLTKWSVGAMAHAPYDQSTMVALAERLTAEVPARSNK